MSLLKQAPRFDLTGAVRLARDMYGLEASAAILSSERDQNFLLTAAASDRYVLKIANASERREMLEAQTAAMAHVADRVPFCQRVLPTLTGDTIGIASENPDSTHDPYPTHQPHQPYPPHQPHQPHQPYPPHQPHQPHFVRLVTYLDGVPLAEVAVRTPALLDRLGRAIGRLDRALTDFDHPAAHREFHWDLAHASRVIGEHLPRISDDGHRNLIARASASALEWIAPVQSTFRRSVIHNDANDWNVLVGDGQIVGIIDFGDMVKSWTVADPAVAIAYAMLGAANPLATAAAIARGYHAKHPLRDEELAALFPLATLRLCMSACIAAWQQQQRPNDEYLIVSQAPIRRTLPVLMEIAPRDAEQALRDACATVE